MATATYCLPSIEKVIGEPLTGEPRLVPRERRLAQSRKVRADPANTRPVALAAKTDGSVVDQQKARAGARGGPGPLTAVALFCPCFFENRNVRVGVLPQRQKIAVDALRLHGVARERERSCQLQARHRVHGIDEHDAA